MLPICAVGMWPVDSANVSHLFMVHLGLGLVSSVVAFFPARFKSIDASIEASEEAIVLDLYYMFDSEASSTLAQCRT
jgi:hypothetical protein